jgi:RNA polymerase sigma-70 factor, ECF subfamily
VNQITSYRGAVTAGEDDAELVRRARLGDKDAFSALVEQHGSAMYRFARRMLRDDGTAEDCVQDALVAAWLSIERFRGDAAVRTWLFGILTNTVRRRVRTEARHPAAPLPDDYDLPGGADPITAAEAQDLRAALEIALAALPPMQRACWILAEVERMSYADIARVQATTVGAVRGAIARARTTLGRRLAPWR